MKGYLTGCLAALGVAGAAEAGLIRYDVTMELTRLVLPNIDATAPGALDVPLADQQCSAPQGGFVGCRGTLDLTTERFGLSEFDRYERVAMASLVLDTEFDRGFGNPDAAIPVCDGSDIICRNLSLTPSSLPARYNGYSATEDGFAISVGAGSFVKDVSSEGLRYDNDDSFSFRIGDTSFRSAGAGLLADYVTTDLTITPLAPVPLPAGGLLLGSALLALGWRRRAGACASTRR